MSDESEKLPKPVVQDLQQAKSLLERLGVDPTTENITALIQYVQNNTTTIHARESDPYLPDAENISEWEKLRPGTAEEVLTLIKGVVQQNSDDASELNKVRRKNEREGFNLSRIIALGCIPVSVAAAALGIPQGLCIAIVVMGIGGPTAASFFNNWGGKVGS